MKRAIINLTAVVFVSAAVTTHAITLTFEDLSGQGPVPVNYMGLTWINWEHYDTPQPPYNPSSGVQRIRNADGATPGIILFGQDVTFTGAWLAGASFDQYFEGYNNGLKIFESAHTANDGSDFGQFFTLNWVGVDEIRVVGLTTGDHYIVDDVTYEVDRIGVPDSGTSVGLFGTALLALAAFQRFGLVRPVCRKLLVIG